MNDGNLTPEELYAHANEMCRNHWGVDYTGTIELVNTKWRRCFGKFIYNRLDEKLIIRFSSKKNAVRTKNDVLGTLLHELIHWRLYTTGVPCHDTDDEFIAECLRVGAPFSKVSAAQDAYRHYLAKVGAAHEQT